MDGSRGQVFNHGNVTLGWTAGRRIANEHERRYRRSQNLVIYLFLGWLPCGGTVLYCNAKWFPYTNWPFAIFISVYFVLSVVTGVQTIVAYYRWKN
jgi:hypothetical protein